MDFTASWVDQRDLKGLLVGSTSALIVPALLSLADADGSAVNRSSVKP